jgi:hypothetical protein
LIWQAFLRLSPAVQRHGRGSGPDQPDSANGSGCEVSRRISKTFSAMATSTY